MLRDTDEDALRLARTLVRGSRYMALAVLDPQTGFPSASRALTGTDIDGVPVILVSALSGHTKGLVADARCSLLAGEPGKGDPLAHPRITVQGLAEQMASDTPQHERIRERFLDRHPKATLYVDFPDFSFFRIVPQAASLNAGFGRAYAIDGSDLVIADPGTSQQWLDLRQKLKTMPEAAAALASRIGADERSNWRIAGVDRAGIDLISGGLLLRHEFKYITTDISDILAYVFTPAK